MQDYMIVEADSIEELESKVLRTLNKEYFDIMGGVVVYKDSADQNHFLQTLYKGPKF